jgi:hypothetical protein
MHKGIAMKALPSLRASGTTNIGHALNIQAVTVFAPSRLVGQDWEILIQELAEHIDMVSPNA